MAALVSTVTQVVTTTIMTGSVSPTSTDRANPQGGIFEGRNPTHYETKNPLTLFIIQAVLVISLTRILHWPLSKLRQPRVIAEVITGIILGPSIMGRIPGFSQTIFPTASMPAFTLAATIGLVMFLFLVGLEVDLRFLVSNWQVALSVGAAGMAIPFGLGVGIAYGLYHEFHDEDNLVPIGFGIYALFIGVALSITAFPVLCRILTSLKLLGTPVGIIVLSAGVANDVVGWILLALCVTLVNSGAGLTALYIFLVAIAYSLFLAYAVRPAFLWILRKSGSLTNGPSQAIVALTMFLVLASAFFTDIIGVHAIFGAFMIGLICPHEGGFAIKLTEKIEDLISVLFLPLYFALSGLSTDLGLLDSGITWAYVVGVTAVAFFGKIGGGTLASRLNGLLWRESATIGVLMSCKGLVELIVLNIGLQARILSIRTFTIFVVMALITTFATTPLTTWLYPPWYQEKVTLWKQGKADWDGNPITPDEYFEDSESALANIDVANKMLVYLRLDGLPSLFNVVSLFTAGSPHRASPAFASAKSDASSSKQDKSGINTRALMLSSPSSVSSEKPLRISGLRMMELTERNSSVMKVAELEDYATRDPVIKAFGTSTVAQRAVRNVTISGQIAVVPDGNFSSTLIGRARELRSDLVLVPWSDTGNISEYPSLVGSQPANDPIANGQYTTFVTEVFEEGYNVANVGIFIDKSILDRPDLGRNTVQAQTAAADRSIRQPTRSVTGLSLKDNHDDTVIFRSSDSRGRHQIRTLYSGMPDDMLAVKIALQLARNEEVEVRIVKFTPPSTNGASISSKATANADDLELTNLKSSLPASISSRIHIEELEDFSPEAVNDALLVNRNTESGDVTLILGRSAITPANETSSSRRVTASKAFQGSWTTGTATGEIATSLGPQAAAMLSSIREIAGSISLLVVQAKKDGDEPGRKASRLSVSSP